MNQNFPGLVIALVLLICTVQPVAAQNASNGLPAAEAAIQDLIARVEALETLNATQQGTIDTLETALGGAIADIQALQSEQAMLQLTVADLEDDLANAGILNLQMEVDRLHDLFVGVSRGNAAYTEIDTLLFEGMDIQIVNGSGSTDINNHTGNLIVGYNEPITASDNVPPLSDNVSRYIRNFGDFKTGSHNLIVGSRLSYSAVGSVVAGLGNESAASYTVAFGRHNSANLNYATVTGGTDNHAFASYSSMSGGYSNVVVGKAGSVSGGSQNSITGTGFGAGVRGGYGNTAAGAYSTILGGANNSTSDDFEIVPLP